MPTEEYDAFVSYRRSDGSQAARWLRRALQSYRVPRSLRRQYGRRRLKVYLDTAYERGTSDFYENTIRPALLSSRWLLVVSTPDARLRPSGAEDWIQREVADFSEGPNGRNVIAVRGAGQFDDPLPADLTVRFPRIEIVDLRGANRLALLNPVRWARLSAEKLKLIAPLLDLPAAHMPALRQEEELRQQVRYGSTIGVTLGVLAAVLMLSVFALQSRYQATRALEDSLFATGRMILSADRGSQGSSNYLIGQGCDLIDKLSTSLAIQPQIAELVVCSMERAKAREELGEHELARAEYASAIAQGTERHARTHGTEPAAWMLAAREALAEYLVRQNQPDRAREEFLRTQGEARRLREQHPRYEPFHKVEANALGRSGDLLLAAGDRLGARDAFEAAAEAVSRSLALLGSHEAEDRWHRISWLARLHRLAAQQRRELDDAGGAIEQLRKGLAAVGTLAAPPSDLLQEAAVDNATLYQLLMQTADHKGAEQARATAISLSDRVISARTTTAENVTKTRQLKQWLMSQTTSQR
jgi:tetratricopeptide (TPR) repeat protein